MHTIRWHRMAGIGVLLLAASCARVQSVARPAPTPGGPSVHAVQLVSASAGWALTDGDLVWTADGGSHWRTATPKGSSVSQLRSVFFLDAQQGWALRGEELLRTSDGGRSWTSAGSIRGTADADVASLQFVDGDHGWVAVRLASSSNFSRGELYATSDGGGTWTASELPSGGPARFLDFSRGWTVEGSEGRVLYETADGGRTWRERTLPKPAAFQSSTASFELPVAAGGGKLVAAVTLTGMPSGVAFFSSDDDGATWRPSGAAPSQRELDPGSRVLADAVDDRTWLAASPDGFRVFSTRDAGGHWDELAPNGLPPGVVALDFASPSLGWSLVQSGSCQGFKSGCVQTGSLLRTSDGGQTWSQLNPAS